MRVFIDHPTHQQQSDFLILVLYDFIVQNILSSLLLLCYNLMILNDYEVFLDIKGCPTPVCTTVYIFF
jgi:hypothetical protein